jgi:two-component system OmpR family sensor kinase
VRQGTVVRSAVLDQTGTPRPLTPSQNSRLASLPPDGSPRTVELSESLGDYRAVAVSGPDGTQLVTALPLQGAQSAVARLGSVVGIVTALGLLVAALAGAFIVGTTLRPLKRVTATATRVAQLPLHSGEVSLPERVPAVDTDPRTEVGQVGAALNQMLSHVEAALTEREDTQRRTRQFVADASHELRTPLAAIQGYAELTRRGGHDLPPDVAHAMRRVESEAQRMSGLVHDLLLLARLDTGPTARREEVDLRRLLADALSDAHASGPAHRWSLSLPEQEVTVLGDAGQLHQSVANLLSNARTHTPEGTPVDLSLTTSETAGGRQAVVTVADQGPGVPEELVDHVFERFARADSSRSRRAGSTGLGLAIVAAIVHHHGGTVSVQSRPGHTAFTVRLPLAGEGLDEGSGDNATR